MSNDEPSTSELLEQLRLAEMAAKDNADWFDNLVHDLAAIYGCEKSASAVIIAAKEHEAGAAALRTALDKLSKLKCYCASGDGDKCDFCRANSALATGAGRELLAEVVGLRITVQSQNATIESLVKAMGEGELLTEVERLRAESAQARQELIDFRSTYDLWPDHRDKVKNLKAELATLRRKVAAAEGMAEALQLAVSDVDDGIPANPQVNGPDLHVECQQVLIEAGWFEDATAALTAWQEASQ